ncbi:MAG TPA: hypothetical protein VGO66_07395 [Solirubrobacterales bacterium]|nr:hypothetical protein [Solirubrobacterales bacterium]
MVWLRAGLVLIVAAAVAMVLVSGGSSSDPRTPSGLPGMPPPFLGIAVVGSGELTAAIDAYGGVVDLRPAAAGPALIEIPAEQQAVGTVPADAGIVPRVRLGDGGTLPLWRADSVRQRYRPGTSVLATTARFSTTQVEIEYAAAGDSLACLTRPAQVVVPVTSPALRCNDDTARRIFRTAISTDRRWLARAQPLGSGAPAWARRLYERSLLVLRALTSARSGAVAAGARDGWAYVWPRDAGTAVLALAASGYRAEARQAAGFLLGLDLDAAARFDGSGTPVEGRDAQGDAAAWVAIAADAAGLPIPANPSTWRDLADYQEKSPGDYLANAIASSAASDGPKAHAYGGKSAHRRGDEIAAEFEDAGMLSRRAEDPGSGIDSAAAWAVQPFPQPALYPAARRSLRQLLADGGRYGIAPSADWPERDPWTAPTAWSAWAFAALAGGDLRNGRLALAHLDRRHALLLLAALRRAATLTGDLPERVDARTGLPRSTTPLVWSHAFAILAMRELWPADR